MSPASYRLDSLAVNLIGRLEPVRRAHIDAPDTCRAAFSRIVAETSRQVALECEEVMGDTAQAQRIIKEAQETFLPLYTRLALARNKEETDRSGLRALASPAIRIFATIGAMFLVTFIVEVLRFPRAAILYVVAVMLPFLPELQLWWSRREYQKRLQEVADDMGALQDAIEATPGQEQRRLPSGQETL